MKRDLIIAAIRLFASGFAWSVIGLYIYLTPDVSGAFWVITVLNIGTTVLAFLDIMKIAKQIDSEG